MSIQNGNFVKLSYTGKTKDDSRVFDTTDEEVAKSNDIFNEKGKYGDIVVIVGAGHTVTGLDEDIVGKEVGYNGSVTIPPEKAFGHRNPELIETIPINKLQEKPHIGMTVQVDGRVGTVIRAIGRVAQVDFNRYLAGVTVIYDYEIKEIIEDTETKVLGILDLYLGKTFPASIEDKTVTIEIGPELTFDQRWLMSKKQIAHEIINNSDIEEIVYLERYNKELFEPKTEAVEETAEE